jgi:hypothetical protein
MQLKQSSSKLARQELKSRLSVCICLNSPIKPNFRKCQDLDVKTWHAKPLSEISLVIKPKISHENISCKKKHNAPESAATEGILLIMKGRLIIETSRETTAPTHCISSVRMKHLM